MEGVGIKTRTVGAERQGKAAGGNRGQRFSQGSRFVELRENAPLRPERAIATNRCFERRSLSGRGENQERDELLELG